MNLKLLECRDNSNQLINSDEPPRKENGRKYG